MSQVVSVWNTLRNGNRRPRSLGLFGLRLTMLCMTAMFVGCEKREARLPTFKVSGKVVQKGKAVPNATVIFHANRTEEGFIKPRAITKPDGTFELTTYESGDGAPTGTYEVSIEQWLRAKPEESPENRLPPSLSNPTTSGLKATVADAVNDLSPFELK
jgi:hypothetical protein